MKKKYILRLLILILLWAIALRSVELLSGNYLFGFDHGRDYQAAYSIVENHKLTLIGAEVGAGAAGISGLFHGPGYYYLIALMYVLFRGDPYGGMILMWVFGLATLGGVYIFTRQMFGRREALVALGMVGISPLLVSQSRFIWNHHPSSLFIVLVLYSAYRTIGNPRTFAPITMFFAAILYHFELAIAVPLVMSFGIAMPFVLRIRDVRVYASSFIAVIIGFAPFFLFEFRHGWLAARSLTSYIVNNPAGSGALTVERALGHIEFYLYNAKNSFFTAPIWALDRAFIALSLGLFLYGIYTAFRSKDPVRRQLFGFMIVTLVVSYAVFLLLNNTIWDYYLIHAHFIYIYIFSCAFIDGLKTFRTSWVAKIFVPVLVVSAAISFWFSARQMIANYTYDYYDLGGVEKIRGKHMAIDAVYEDAGGKPFSVFVFMPPIYTYPYDYLFATYGKGKYGYQPGSQKQGTVYLIIEPDNAKLWTYKGWLETVIVGGDIIETKTLVTGHIIQKRKFE